MTQASIKLGTEKFGRSAAGLVYGQISLALDGACFPHPEWSDFVIVVLAWWCRALSRILRREGEPIEIRFMEGPYLAELQIAQHGFVSISLVEAGLQRRVNRRAEVETTPLAASAVEAADRAIAECKTRRWWSRDADELVAAAAELQQELRRTTS